MCVRLRKEGNMNTAKENIQDGVGQETAESLNNLASLGDEWAIYVIATANGTRNAPPDLIQLATENPQKAQ